jgi:hypothetical protein
MGRTGKRRWRPDPAPPLIPAGPRLFDCVEDPDFKRSSLRPGFNCCFLCGAPRRSAGRCTRDQLRWSAPVRVDRAEISPTCTSNRPPPGPRPSRTGLAHHRGGSGRGCNSRPGLRSFAAPFEKLRFRTRIPEPSECARIPIGRLPSPSNPSHASLRLFQPPVRQDASSLAEPESRAANQSRGRRSGAGFPRL